MTTARHRVAVAQVPQLVLTLATCLCGWQVGYDASTYDAAVRAAHDHCEDALLADLEEPS